MPLILEKRSITPEKSEIEPGLPFIVPDLVGHFQFKIQMMTKQLVNTTLCESE